MAAETVKEIVDVKKELAKGAASVAPVTPKPKVFRFKKLQFPLQKIKLSGGKIIQFAQRKLNTGGNSVWGLFETTDESIAKQLREVAEQGKQHVVELR